MTRIPGLDRSRLVVALVGALLLSGCGGGGGDDPMGANQALTAEPTIRIGVVPASASITIGSAGSYSIRSKATGTVLFTASNATATVTLGSGAMTTTNYRLQVTCGNATTVATRKAAAEAAGYPTYTEFVAAANCTRLYIGALPSTATTAERQALKDELVSKGLAGTDAIWKVVSITVGTTVYRVQQGAATADSDSPVVLSADTDVTINGLRYRGVAEVIRNSAGTLAGVNELPIEQYLYGVVPRELGPEIWGQPEAQKAQAVAARAYAVRGIGKRASDGYDMLGTVADQVYGGAAAEHPVSTAAVDATRGIVPVWSTDGKVIESLFFSTSGGWTANNEDVFNSTAIPYLRGVRDQRHGHREYILDELEHAVNPRKLRHENKKDFEYGQSDYHRWTIDWTPEEMSEVVTDFAKTLPGGFAGDSVGKVVEINVLERSNSGRAKTIEYVTEQGVFTDTKDHIRSSLRYFNDSGVKANLLSTLFLLKAKRNHCDGEIESFVAWGGGFGHGVGMSQTGAAGMAERGYTYEEILHHYYQEITLTPWY